MSRHPPMMAQATVDVEVSPPDPPDPPIITREDLPPLSNGNKSSTNRNANKTTFTDDKNTKDSFPTLSSNKTHRSSNQMNTFHRRPFTRYLEIDFGDINRRDVNPFKIQNEIQEITGEKVKELTGMNKSKLTLQTKSAEQTAKCLNISSLAGKTCKINLHPKFNTCKGLIFLRQFETDDTEEFKINLQEYYDIENVEKATFIKTKPGVTPYILTFNQENTPYTLYIPGEISDTVINPFIPRPMMCKGCLEYGHTQKRCKKSVLRCKKCSDTGHEERDCTAQASKCYHCAEDHVAGARDCVKQIQEQKILDTVETEKVTFQRARQILTEKPVTRLATANLPVFPTLFDVTLPRGTKRKINPWLVEKCIQQHTGKMPRKCRGKSNSEDTFVVEVGSENEARLMSTFTKIGTYDVVVTVNNTFKLQKGIIYIQGYNLSDFDSYREGLMKQHNISQVEQATWIKTKNIFTNALILSFQHEMPNYIDIPGESTRTLVNEYKRIPNLCKTCLEYGHPQRVCRGDQRCHNCTSTEHSFPPCELDSKCLHCPMPHKTGDKSCQQYKIEEEILAIQAKHRVSRNQAIVIFDRNTPNIRSMNFAAALATTTSNPTKTTTTKSSTSAAVPPTVPAVPSTSTAVPPTATNMPSTSTAVPSTSTTVPPTSNQSTQNMPTRPKPQPPKPPRNDDTSTNKFNLLTDENENSEVNQDLDDHHKQMNKHRSSSHSRASKTNKTDTIKESKRRRSPTKSSPSHSRSRSKSRNRDNKKIRSDKNSKRNNK